jgi:glycogen debranching enzyme
LEGCRRRDRHPDGDCAKLPIATVELQGYLYAARLAMAELSERRGDDGEAARLREDAAALRDLVEDKFWLADDGFYAIALDGDKKPVASISSNPGSCCGPVWRAPLERVERPNGCLPTTCSPDGDCARCRRNMCGTTRCRTNGLGVAA